MDEVSPPIQHVLRPHHVGLLAVFLLVFHPSYAKKPPSRFLLHIHRVLLNEVAESVQPKPYRKLLHEIGYGLNPAPDEARKLVDALTLVSEHLQSADLLSDFFNDIPALYVEGDDESAAPPFIRRSIFGYFCRRCFVSFNKLSFKGVIKLAGDFSAWAAGDHAAGYQRIVKDSIRDDNFMIRLQYDREPYAEPDSYAAFEKTQAVADPHLAVESLRRFFEQKFHDNPDSEIRQHAMLNLARMQYAMGHGPSARRLVLEAITVARTVGDNVTLQHCMSLLRRLTGSDRFQKEPLNELAPDISPLEVLYDVRQLLNESQPLSDAFEKMVQAAGIYDISRDFRGNPLDAKDQWAFHGVQAIVWRLAGCEKLAAIEEDIVLAFTDSGGSDDVRLKVFLNKAQQLSRQGRYEDAFKILLDPGTWRGLNMGWNQHREWAAEVWHTMARITTHRGHDRHLREFLHSRRPVYGAGKRDYHFVFPERANPGPRIENLLSRVLLYRHYDQSVTVVDQVLKALWQAEYQGHFGSYRLGLVLLADVGLEFGMTVWCRRLIEEVMPQIITGDDIELRGFACFVLVRCIIASSGKNFEGLRDALPYLAMAEIDYRTLEMSHALADVLYLTSVVFHNLGMERERDGAAARHAVNEEQSKRSQTLDVDDQFKDIWELVTEVGTALASR